MCDYTLYTNILLNKYIFVYNHIYMMLTRIGLEYMSIFKKSIRALIKLAYVNA